MDPRAEAQALLDDVILCDGCDGPAARWGALQERLRAAHAGAELELLTELGRGLAAALHRGEPAARERARSGLERVLPCLALLPRGIGVQALLELAAQPGVLAPRRHGHADGTARWLGALLGSAQDEAVLAQALARRERTPLVHTLDVLACWVQEKLLRGGAVEACVEVWRFADELRRLGHPLGRLPTRLLPIERGAPRWAASYGLSHAASWTVPVPPAAAPVPRWPAGAAVPPHGDVTTADEAERIGAAWQSACQVSNGKSEARVLLFERPLAGLPVAAELLCALGLECLRGVAPTAVRVHELGAEAAYGILLGMASNGGDYNTAWSGAYGRLAAWRSLGGLCGAAPGAAATMELPAIEQAARRCRWSFFSAPGPWFDEVVSDFAVVALRPDEESLAVLAATDSD